jgi:hypothetical protein
MNILNLVRDAITTELRNRVADLRARFEAPPEPAHVAVSPMAQPVPSPWESNTFHGEQLAATTCYDCGKPKDRGWYRCHACVAKRKA